ncbi:MAG: hypothetical protein SNF33_07840 [Candidatus Algichlamydia australiensis]|nr:hypothetical protein [Chlamydiales bacterium]
MGKLALLVLSIVFSLPLFPAEPLLIINSLTTSSTLPNRFRNVAPLSFFDPSLSAISNEGLSEMHASASSQFSIEELRAIKTEFSNEHLVIIDLRQESHGFINNYAVSWYVAKNWINQGLSIHDVIRDEQ